MGAHFKKLTFFVKTAIWSQHDEQAVILYRLGRFIGYLRKEDVIKKVKTNYDYSTNTFGMIVLHYSGDALLERLKSEAEPLYDEERYDGYIEFNEERYYFSETFDTNGLN